MRSFSAQYVFTNNGPPLKKGIVTTHDDGRIIKVEDTSGNLQEKHSLEFYNGIIIPGFVNCHCHLELSNLKDKIPAGTGLGGFLPQVTKARRDEGNNAEKWAGLNDSLMSDEGIVLCADTCNTSVSFGLKKKSNIRYINLLEVFGIDPASAARRMSEIQEVSDAAERQSLEWYYSPHSVYSVSTPLFNLLKDKSGSNKVTSIHFLESAEERKMLSDRSGPLMDAYRLILSPSAVISTPCDHVSAILNDVTSSGNLILVHNCVITDSEIERLRERKNLFYCLCAGSNRHISGIVPPASLLRDEKCNIVVGTDSLSSNSRLSILNEIRILQEEFPAIPLDDLIKWSTLNGAKALASDSEFGSLEPGKKPGLVLLKNLDLDNLKLLDTTTASRLI